LAPSSNTKGARLAVKKPRPPKGAPKTLYAKGGVICEFNMVAPITGDLIYKGVKGDRQRGDQVAVHLMITNPDAVEHQRQVLLRGG
jgi:hypothetical protein